MITQLYKLFVVHLTQSNGGTRESPTNEIPVLLGDCRAPLYSARNYTIYIVVRLTQSDEGAKESPELKQ